MNVYKIQYKVWTKYDDILKKYDLNEEWSLFLHIYKKERKNHPLKCIMIIYEKI